MQGTSWKLDSMLIAVEGIDGAGKNTLAEGLKRLFVHAGRTAHVISFPGYERTEAGRLIGSFLGGSYHLPQNPFIVATMFALDRAENLNSFKTLLNSYDVVIADRYVASNAAYQAARANHNAEEISDWVLDLEFRRFQSPVPDATILIDIDIRTAQELVRRKAKRSYTDQAMDKYEGDFSLLSLAAERYKSLCRSDKFGAWLQVAAVSKGALRTRDEIAGDAWTKLQSLGLLA